MSMKNELVKYIDASFPILYINSFEEYKVTEIMRDIADRRRVHEWCFAEGYSLYDSKSKTYIISKEDMSLINVLKVLLSDSKELNRSVLIIKDAHIILDDLTIIPLLKEISLKINEGLDCSIILVSSIVKIPKELEKFITIIDMDLQSSEDIKKQINEFMDINEITPITPKFLDDLSTTFKGLSEYEIQNILALAVADDGELKRNDLELIFNQKKQLILKSGILDMVYVKESIEDIGGLENLKQWLENKSCIIKNLNEAKEYGVDTPKGVLIAGVPGCGKSLCAKVASKLFEVPLLRLDMGRLMGQYLGESEANMRKAIQLAEAVSPCILWVDELEKAFAGIGGGGHEVTNRLFGTFLTWMQEKKEAAFVVATANDITKLPPEMLRKGRFDEIFYVGLPNEREREKILSIHISKRRKQDLKNIEIQKIIKKTEGYSGADLEGIVSEAIEMAFIEQKELNTEYLLKAIENTHSLSEIMKEPIEKMKKEYENRKFKNASK